jgi:glycerol dehydrogenase-like iron-containing ADH family enzyme
MHVRKRMMIISNVFLIPGTIISGNEVLEKSGSYLKESGNKALIVTDKMMVHWKCSKINQPLVVERQQSRSIHYLKELFSGDR